MDPEANNTDKALVDTTTDNATKPEAGTSPEQDAPTAFYKSKAEEEKARADSLAKELEQARYTLAQKRIEEKGDTVDTKDVVIDPAEIAKQVREQLEMEKAQAFRNNLSNRIEDKEELAQVEYFLDNVIKSTGDLEKDLELAISLSNGKKYQVQNQEMARALSTKGKEPDLSSNKIDGDSQVKLSEADKRFIALADSKKSSR